MIEAKLTLRSRRLLCLGLLGSALGHAACSSPDSTDRDPSALLSATAGEGSITATGSTQTASAATSSSASTTAAGTSSTPASGAGGAAGEPSFGGGGTASDDATDDTSTDEIATDSDVEDDVSQDDPTQDDAAEDEAATDTDDAAEDEVAPDDDVADDTADTDDSASNDDADDTAVDGDAGVAGELPVTDHCAAVADWDPEWLAWEEEVLLLVNEARAVGHNCDTEGEFGPAGPLTMNGELTCSARLHSLDMFEQGFFAHESPDGSNPGDRIDAVGYEWSTYGENIAQGYSSPEMVVEGWLDSDGHCSNIMNENFTELGVGYYPGDTEEQFGSDRHYWTQNFGAPRQEGGGFMGGNFGN